MTYVPGYYAEQSPEFIRFAMLLTGYLPAATDTAEPTYCELGFGYGLGLSILAASHPHMTFWGTDFLAEQVSFARRLSEGICPNLNLTDDSFEEFLARETPQFDFITLHGIWSWISPENQRAVLEILRRKLKLGGAVYVSYNALPGWHVIAPLRGLLLEHARSASPAGDSAVAKAQRAIAFVEQLAQNKAPAVAGNSALLERLQALKTAAPAYVAHEYLNEHWRPLYFSEVAAAMSEAKLAYAGSSRVVHMVDTVNVSSVGQRHLQSVTDPVLREVVRDYYMNTGFRQDVFTRGAPRLSIPERDQRLDRVRLLAVANPADINLSVKTALGESRLHDDVYRPILDRLQAAGANGVTIAELHESKGLKDRPRPATLEAAALLIAIGAAFPLIDERAVDARASTAALNRRIAQMNALGFGVDFLASPVSRNGHAVDRLTGYVLDAYRRGMRDPQTIAEAVWAILQRTDQRALKDGKRLETAEQNLEHLRWLARSFVEDGWRKFDRLGLI
ncbi:MAG TPA: class I SAM-dependent methyltransferase [Burkholderiaceae bacterium]|nr:class I SAM-dependent methyltransferase [Burkholderiaceae bacterium]